MREAPPNVRGLVAVMYAAGLVNPRNKPEVDMAHWPFLPDDYFLQGAYFLEPVPEPEPLVILPDHTAPNGDARILLPGHA